METAEMRDYFTFVGLGQCGMRVCQKFSTLGFSTAYINSDEVDTRDFAVADEDNLLLLRGTGTGKSLRVGSQILEESRSKFETFLRKHTKKDMTIFVAGAGGGTGGSFIAPAVEYAKELGKKVGVVLTLPPKMLGIVPANNALKTVQDLLKEKLDMFVIIDNEMLLDSVGRDDTWWGKINDKIVSNFYSIMDVTRADKSTRTGLGSIDQSEVFRAITFGKGLTDIRKVYLTMSACTQAPEELSKLLFKPELVDGYDYKTTLCNLICVDVPPGGHFVNVAKSIFDISKKKIGNSISILGMCVDPVLRDYIKVTYIQSGLKLPKILQSRIKNLRRDEQNFADKQTKEDQTQDAMDGLDFNDDLLDGEFTGL